MARSVAHRIRRSLSRNGGFGTIRLAIYNLAILTSGRSRDHRYVHDRSFDLEYGVDTGGVVEIDEMANPAGSLEHAGRYEAVDPAWFGQLISRTGINNVEDYWFLDIGSGKGRALMLGALAGFRNMIGVEIDEGLHSSALSNIEAFGSHVPRANFSLHNVDLRDFDFPCVPILCVANNPVDQPLFHQLIEKIEESLLGHPRQFYFIYLHSLYVEVFSKPHWNEIDSGLLNDSTKHPYAIYQWRI